jgi:hypothetical protein
MILTSLFVTGWNLIIKHLAQMDGDKHEKVSTKIFSYMP